MTVLRDKLTDVATSVTDSASGVGEGLQSRAKDAWDTVHDRTDRAVRKSSTYLHKNPVPAALMAFGVGFVLGTLVSRRAPGSLKQHSIAQLSRGVPFGLIIACITLLRSICFSGPRGAEAGSPERKDCRPR